MPLGIKYERRTPMKKLLAILLAAALVFSFAACGKNDSNSDETTTSADSQIVDESTENIDNADATISDESTTVSVSENDAQESSSESEAASQPDSDDESSAATSDSSTQQGETTSAAVSAAPKTTAEIVSVYNNAVNSAFNAKAGFEKERKTDNEKLDAGVALKAFKSLVYKFMGVGEDNKYTETVAKGNWDTDARRNYLRKSTLTSSDVTKASCTEKNGKYTIVLNVKDGSSKGSETQKYTNAPIDKCGICVGNEDKGYYDHKTGEVIYDAIAGTYAGAVIDEKYNNAKVTAVVDVATGHLVSLTVEFNIEVAIDISIGSGTATATTHIYYKNFKY